MLEQKHIVLKPLKVLLLLAYL